MRNSQNPKTATTNFIMRMTTDERLALRKLAAQMNLTQAAFIRTKIFDGLPVTSQKSNLGLDHDALSKLLVMLGESRIANNLNQLAKHANMGTLDLTDEKKQLLEDACLATLWMRRNLIKTLGVKP